MIEDNKFIAEFMKEDRYFMDDLKYNESWDWLMPVVGKIEKILSENIAELGYSDACLRSSDLDARYQAVVEFIKWYNKNKK